MYFLSTFCGVCLTGRREVQNINNKDTDDISLVEKLKYCSFQTAWIDDNLPLFICYKCYNDLKIAYSFKKMCVSNSTILKGYVSRLKCGDSSVADHQYRQLRVDIEQNKIYGVNILLYERVQVEEIEMDVSSSDGESSFGRFEDTAIDIKEESVQIKAEDDENQAQCNGEQEDVICVEQNEHLDKNQQEIIEIKEESTAEADKDICFVEVMHECNANHSPEPEHILPDLHYGPNGPNLTNSTASRRNSPSSGGEVNLLNIINDQISHFLTSDEKVDRKKSKPAEISTLRSLLEASKVAQSHVMQSLNTGNRTEQVDDDIECISSDSDSTTDHSEYRSTKSVYTRHRFKRKVNENNSVPVVSSTTTLPQPSLTNVRPQQLVNTALSRQPATYPEVSQSYPLVTDNMNTTICTENYVQPTNTFLIIYDDINPPAAPLVANTKPTSGFILSEASLAQNTVPFDNNTDRLTVQSASTAPLVINTDTSNGYVLPTSSFTYQNKNSNGHFVQETSVGTQNLQGCSYVLPTVEDETSLDSEPSDSNATSVVCPMCKKTFTKNKYLKQHFETHYSVTHKCNICAKNFFNEKTLKTHILMHKGGQNYQCDYCSKMFDKLSEFKKHSSIHVGVKQFECSVCEKRFIKRSSLTKHLVSHNDGKSHKCSLCNQVFQYKCRLEKHMLKQHPNK